LAEKDTRGCNLPLCQLICGNGGSSRLLCRIYRLGCRCTRPRNRGVGFRGGKGGLRGLHAQIGRIRLGLGEKFGRILLSQNAALGQFIDKICHRARRLRLSPGGRAGCVCRSRSFLPKGRKRRERGHTPRGCEQCQEWSTTVMSG
jgi:hypothetical protein